MSKEYVLELSSRQRGKEELGIRQHFGSISVIGVYAQIKYRGGELPEKLRPVEEHISNCETCPYDVSSIIAAMKAEDEAMMEYLVLPEEL